LCLHGGVSERVARLTLAKAVVQFQGKSRKVLVVGR
jgi:hypothetical protein